MKIKAIANFAMLLMASEEIHRSLERGQITDNESLLRIPIHGIYHFSPINKFTFNKTEGP